MEKAETNNLEEINSDEKFVEVMRFIGKNHRYIRQALRDEMIVAWGKTMMVKPCLLYTSPSPRD